MDQVKFYVHLWNRFRDMALEIFLQNRCQFCKNGQHFNYVSPELLDRFLTVLNAADDVQINERVHLSLSEDLYIFAIDQVAPCIKSEPVDTHNVGAL